MALITTCSNCGSQFKWDERFWKGAGMPDCPACGFNNQTGRKGKGEGPIELGYRKMARGLAQQFGSLQYVEYLSHYPNFEINFVFDTHTIYSGRRRGEYDINFLSLGYVGEGPRYAQSFLDELGFSMTSEEIASITPGAIIKLDNDKVVVKYKTAEKGNQPRDKAYSHATASQQVARPAKVEPRENQKGKPESTGKSGAQNKTQKVNNVQSVQKVVGITVCPNCNMKVFPKSDGTCPSCQSIIM
jgi:rubrerythrin